MRRARLDDFPRRRVSATRFGARSDELHAEVALKLFRCAESGGDHEAALGTRGPKWRVSATATSGMRNNAGH